MKYLLIFLCLFLAACDDLPKSGGNTGAYWYMKGWRTIKPGEPGQILTLNEKGEPEWRDVTPEDRIKLVDSLTVDEGLSKRNEYDSFPLIPIQQ